VVSEELTDARRGYVLRSAGSRQGCSGAGCAAIHRYLQKTVVQINSRRRWPRSVARRSSWHNSWLSPRRQCAAAASQWHQRGWWSGGARPDLSPLGLDLGSKGLARCKAVSQERPDALATGWVVQVVVRCSSVGLETSRWELSGVSPAVLEAGGPAGYGYEDKAHAIDSVGTLNRTMYFSLVDFI
jgi:hypothetical protein